MNKILPDDLNQKNLVIITSVINTSPNKLSYTKTRSIYTHAERFNQTCKTIESIKKHIPNSYIILLECGKLNPKYQQIFNTSCNKVINYINNKQISDIIHKSLYKGYAESKVIRTFLTEYDISFFNSLYKISGRYTLNSNFNYQYYDNTFNCFKYITNHNITEGVHTSTVFYKITNGYFLIYKKALKSYKQKLLKGVAIEKLISIAIPNIKIVDSLGVEGTVAVNGLFISY
jgi:hypothetical protein